MATVEMRTVNASNERTESRADRVLSLVAVGGAVGGALAGTVLGAEADGAFRAVYGAAGTILGSGFAVGAWGLVADLWTRAFVGYEAGHARDLAAAQR